MGRDYAWKKKFLNNEWVAVTTAVYAELNKRNIDINFTTDLAALYVADLQTKKRIKRNEKRLQECH